MAEVLFWIAVGAVVYTYCVFPLLLLLMASVKQVFSDVRFQVRRGSRRRDSHENALPRVALLVAAHNEEAVIEAKLANMAALDYPSERMEFLLGLDAPTDSTAERARGVRDFRFKVVEFSSRRGKLAVLKDLAELTSAEVLVFSDANTMLAPDCVRALVRHFHDLRVGAACGELRLKTAGAKSQMEPIYWRYEIALKFLENRLNCVLGANGAVYAVRRELFRPTRPWIVEDFQLPMEIRFSGYRVVYDPEAVGTEDAAPTFSSEFRRKVRIGGGDIQVFLGNLKFLNPLKGLPALAYFSHKVLRWLGPLFLLSAFSASAVLLRRPYYGFAFAVQVGLYLSALTGFWLQRKRHSAGVFSAPLHFVAMNLALLFGMVWYLSGRQKAVWSTTPRPINSSISTAERVCHE